MKMLRRLPLLVLALAVLFSAALSLPGAAGRKAGAAQERMSSEEALSPAAPALRFICVCSGSSVSDTHSWYDFIWSFQWSDPPVGKRPDMIAFHWFGDLTMDEDSTQASITYQGEDGTITEDFSDEMKYGIMPNKNMCAFAVPAEYHTDKSVVRGSGSFRMRCNDHRHTNLRMGWAYDQTVGKAASTKTGVDAGFPAITFGKEADELEFEYRKFYVTD